VTEIGLFSIFFHFAVTPLKVSLGAAGVAVTTYSR